jgi:hypothetical protein
MIVSFLGRFAYIESFKAEKDSKKCKLRYFRFKEAEKPFFITASFSFQASPTNGNFRICLSGSSI